MNTCGNRDAWEKARILTTIFSALLIPVVIAIVGNWYTSALSKRELDVRYVEIAISILSSEPKKETKMIRHWAVDVINTHSSVKMSEEAKREVLDNVIQIQESLLNRMEEDRQKQRELQELTNKIEELRELINKSDDILQKEKLREKLRELENKLEDLIDSVWLTR